MVKNLVKNLVKKLIKTWVKITGPFLYLGASEEVDGGLSSIRFGTTRSGSEQVGTGDFFNSCKTFAMADASAEEINRKIS